MSLIFFDKKAFSVGFLKTIEPKDSNLEFLLGNREGLSFYDAKMANLAYKCSSNLKKYIKFIHLSLKNLILFLYDLNFRNLFKL